MKKTVFKETAVVIDDFEKLDKQLADMRLVLACIAFQQDDKTLSVPVAAIEAMPKGISLDITFDRLYGNYHFKAILPEAESPKSEGVIQ